MHPVEALEHLGGLSNHSSLCRLTTRQQIRQAVDDGLIIQTARDRYAHKQVAEARRLAHATNGVLCLASAALARGWEVKEMPRRPQVCYPKDRRLPAHLRAQVEPRWADLADGDIDGCATAPGKTLEMCGRLLPYDDALAIADSALRNGERATLTSLRHAQGRGAARIRRIVRDADPRAANPFESVLRAICADVKGLHVEPQVAIDPYQIDLVDEDLRIAAEADSFRWHGGRAALRRDATRYNDLVVWGWMVLRFSWEDVMHEQERVRRTLEDAVVLARQRTKLANTRRFR